MNPFYSDYLSNGIKVITRNNPNTPRISINLFMTSGAKLETLAGTSNLAGRLLLQGTKTQSAEQLANELDSNAIELGVEAKQDFLRARALFLNEDLEKAVDIFEDIIKNSTFHNLEKEVMKFMGEIQLELDSPKTQAFDNLVRTMFQEHPYGHTYTKILNDLPNIKAEGVKDFYLNTSYIPDRMIFSIVGDIEREKILKILEERFGSITANTSAEAINIKYPELTEDKIVTIENKEAAQAQILRGWFGPGISEDDFPALTLLNIILGSSGLSSRLFVELRDKKGLAYSVRSSIETLKHSGLITVYIGTAPNNIKTCLEGFETEINKLKQYAVEEKELSDAKNNYLGKRAFLHETNIQQAYYLGYYDTMGVTPEFDSLIEEKIKKVSTEDILVAANKYFSRNSVISILAPPEFLTNL